MAFYRRRKGYFLYPAADKSVPFMSFNQKRKLGLNPDLWAKHGLVAGGRGATFVPYYKIALL